MQVSDLPREDVVCAFTYLDNLRTSGVTNMLAGGQYLESELEMEPDAARAAHVAWMATFSRDKPIEERVDEVMTPRASE